MPRERANFRDILSRLDAAFPGKEYITHTELANFCGCARSTLWRRCNLPKHTRMIHKIVAARELADEA